MSFMESLRQSNRLELSKEPLDEFPVELTGLSRVNLFSGHFLNYSAVLWSLFMQIKQEFPTCYRGLMVLGNDMVFELCSLSDPHIKEDKGKADKAVLLAERAIPPDIVRNDCQLIQVLSFHGFPALFYGPAPYVHLTNIIQDVLQTNGGLVINDFVELGLHYSQFNKFWEVLYEAACENDVVLALGTQSLEVIGSWYEFFLERGEQNLTYFRIDHLEGERGLRVVRYDFEVLGAALEIGLEVR